ncbi:MAG: Nif3-like dinuclear metal center hexameric protein [Candidatus Sericytochromatia bacterium]|nr:Nif3-like dinuclear metal center hexameric protein [Candidatus Sericytochromatia bacterium]
MNTLTVQDVIDRMVALAPPRLAESWDNVGLMVGHPGRALRGITVALDPTYEAVQAALAQGSNLLITHHPLLFKPPRSLDLRAEPGRTLEALIKADCALYAAHTNLDATAVNQALAASVGVLGTEILHRTGSAPIYKVGVHVPASHVETVSEAAWAAGAGKTEHYERAAYRWETAGTYANAAKTVSNTQEWRLEFMVPSGALKAVRQAIFEVHPYQEPALDVVMMQGDGTPEGFGLVGELPAPIRLADFARHIKTSLALPAVRLVGDPDRMVQRVGWLGGSGGDYWKDALAARVEAYITGELRHHAALDGLAAGLSFIEIGHVGSEQPVVPFLAEYLRAACGPGVPVHALPQVDPFLVI